MAGLLNRLAPKGYPGQIFVCMLRYGYGNQQHIEKMELLHSWYSHLRAFLPEKYAKKTDEYNNIICGVDTNGHKINLLDKAHEEILSLFAVYDPAFEKADMTTNEKDFILALWAVYERLDEITAKSKIIDDMKADGEAMEV
jgi:hypothetical protein